MKKFTLLALGVFVSAIAFCQGENPVQWAFTAQKKGDKLYTVVMTATFARPWHIYSQKTPDGGPIPTKITFKTNPLLVLDGDVKEEGQMQTVHDENFGVDVKYYSDKVVFSQVVKLKANVKTHATGTLQYMVCNDQRCLPPKTIPFDITL
ncbi:MAG TPA: protein-disulfide reductase DsbD domain-containing protein [Chitinophagaceae bacterium]|jgi:thiol:disulfide interchange protein DsbD|nr:protein-disulfide reductase DsbD domain-containing protein [Chitinophagaceae bacterium]